MALGGCLTCIKYLLFIFNFLFWLAGCILLGMGIWLVVESKNLDNLANIGVSIGGYGLIVIGSIIMIVGFFGCCGAIKESQCLLVTFFICLFILFGIMVGLGIYFAINANGFDELTFKLYKEAADNYGKDNISKETIDSYHKRFSCCGHTLGVADFKGQIPEGCVTNALTKCPPKLSAAAKNNFLMIAGVALGIGVVLLLGMIFSMMLCCAIRDSV